MCLRYSGSHGDFPVYMCSADLYHEGRPCCQQVRALAVDAEVERLILAALTPDRIALAVAAVGEIEQEARLIEQQWSLKRERARYDAERARRQYDAVEPENRLVARSLERAGKNGCAASSRSNRSTMPGVGSRRRPSPIATANKSWRWVKICHNYGAPPALPRRIANRSCGW